MAPDINSLPASPRQARPQPARTSSDASRRTSMPPPPPPVPSHYASRSPVMISNEQVPFPIRHPRPLTAVELYLEVEKEQEAVVNRLTRELTALRAQSASVASNASHSSTSTSASLLPVDISDPNPAHQLTGATHPTPSRRHRSSSSLSARSLPNTPSTSAPVTGSGTTHAATQTHPNSTANVPISGQSQASADRAAAASRNQGNLSREPSITTSLSGRSTPARQSLDIARQPASAAHRPSLSRDPSYQSQSTTASSTAAHAGTPATQPLSPTQSITSQHYTETAASRSEMEAVKSENEMLRQRVRALERALRARRRDSSNSDVARSDISTRLPRDREAALSVTSSAVASPEPRSAVSPGLSGGGMVAAWDGGVGGVAPPRERSESQSTTASSRRGTAVAADDEVRMGESAGSLGVTRGT